LPRKKKQEYPEFWEAVKRLKRDCPLDLPVTVRRLKKMKDHGLCKLSKDKKRYYLAVHHVLHEYESILVLLHEWAHALATDYEVHEPDVPHNAYFGMFHEALYWKFKKIGVFSARIERIYDQTD